MPAVEVTYYTGSWSDAERKTIRAVLEAQGFTVSEGAGSVKGFGVEVPPPQLLIEIGLAALTTATILANAVTAIIGLCRELRHKDANTTIQLIAERRIYIVPVTHEQSAEAIPQDFGDDRQDRRGDMTWRDGAWKTVEELYGLPPKPSPTGPRKGRPPQARTRTRKTRTRKGRRGQTR